VVYRFDRFQVDDEAFRLSADGQTVALEPKTLRVLLCLLRNRSRLIRKSEILDEVWQDANVTEGVLTRSIGLLRKVLEDDSREPRFIETVPAAGYRFIAEVSVAEQALAPAAAAAAPLLEKERVPEQEQVRPGRRRRRLWLAAAAGVCLVLLVAAMWAIRRQRRADAPIRSLAVLPLVNLSGDPGEEYFADGLTDELITDLASIQNLRVVSRTSVMADKDTHKTLRQIADELRVDAVVEGSVVRSGDRVRITAQLIDARSDKHLWARSFEGPANDVLSLQDNVARQIAEQARVALAPASNRAGVNLDPAAYDAYLRGRYFFDKGDYRRSADYFDQAIAIEPSYSSAYAGLADALEAGTTFGIGRLDEVMPKAIAAAKRAISLDPANGEAYTALGSIQTIYEWNWSEAEQNLTRGIALSPSYPLAHMKYAVYLDATGRPQEAVKPMRRALDLAPLSFFMTRRLGATLYLARDYDEAIQQLQRANELNPNLPSAVEHWIAMAYAMKGMRDEAVDHDLVALRGDWPKLDTGRLRSIYKREGWEAYWRARIDALLAFDDGGCGWFEAGRSYVLAKDMDDAFSSLNRAVDQRCYEIAWLQTDPLLDPIRGDPRYKALLQRVNLSGR
jgi:TolB-like protein/DNA-binding winged helix-turn-helix (wHTH) protein/Tfp pilus assembly protein PilF